MRKNLMLIISILMIIITIAFIVIGRHENSNTARNIGGAILIMANILNLFREFKRMKNGAKS